MKEPNQYRLTDDNIDRVVSMCKSLITAESPDDAESLQSAVELLGQMAKKMPAELPVSDGGQAFPRFVPDGHYNGSVDCQGMTLRDYFAGQWMAGFMSNPGCFLNMKTNAEYAEQAYKFGDAMIQARTK